MELTQHTVDSARSAIQERKTTALALAEAAALGLSGSLALAAIAAVVGLLLPKGAARMVLRIIFLGLLMLFFFRSRWLPDVELTGTALCLGVTAVAIAALRRMIVSS